MPAVETHVREFRQILLWPVQLMPHERQDGVRSHWELLSRCGPHNPWSLLEDEFTSDPTQFQERHYREFVTFLPHVQRFLYGQAQASHGRLKRGDSPIRVFRRHDVVKARLGFEHGEPVELDIKHVDLYFFYDIDVAILVIELIGRELSLDRVQDIVFRFGRAFPTGWDADGHASHCMRSVEWLDASNQVLCQSDFDDRAKFLTHTGTHRSIRVGAHWEFLLRPMVPHQSSEQGLLRYRQLEYHRMPKICYLAVDNPQAISRHAFVRLALGLRPGTDAELNYSQQAIDGIERDLFYDRFWSNHSPDSAMRVTCNGHTLNFVGCARDPWYVDEQYGLLGQFRHQYFLVGLIAHFHKAALLQLSNRLVAVVSELDVDEAGSPARFKLEIRQCLETFLRFNHRYWFHEVSNQPMAQELYALLGRHLSNRALFSEIREEILDMGQYLDSEDSRRNGDAVLRLTVVTILGLVGTIVTGFLGMNLIAAADKPLAVKISYFLAVLIPATLFTLFMIRQSSALARLLDTASDRRLGWRESLRAAKNLFKRSADKN